MTPIDPDDPELAAMTRRIRRTAAVSTGILTAGAWAFWGWRAAGALACSAILVMINFVWLEQIVRHALRASREINPAMVGARILIRSLLLTISLVTIVAVARFEPVSVAIGFSVIVIGIFGEAGLAVRRSIAGD